MKRIFVLLLALAALLCFAMPAIASPPGGLPTLEVSSLVADIAPAYLAQEVAPVIAAAPAFAESATTFVSASALEASIGSLLIIATAAMLAGLIPKASSFILRLRSERGFANGTAGSRRWV